MGMKKGFFVLILLIMLMSSKTYDSNILMSGIGTSDLGAAIIRLLTNEYLKTVFYYFRKYIIIKLRDDLS